MKSSGAPVATCASWLHGYRKKKKLEVRWVKFLMLVEIVERDTNIEKAEKRLGTFLLFSNKHLTMTSLL